MEIIRLRPHHATKIREQLEWKTDIEDLGELMERAGYDNQAILATVDIYSKMKNPQQIIEILPDRDLIHDPICQKCVSVRKERECDRRLCSGEVDRDSYESLRFSLKSGDQLTVEELRNRKAAFGPHFKI